MAVKLITQYRWMELTGQGELIPPTPIMEDSAEGDEGTTLLAGVFFDTQLEAVLALIKAYEYTYSCDKEYTLQPVVRVSRRY